MQEHMYSRFGVYFGLPAQFWLNLQNDYDLRTASTTAWHKAWTIG